MTGSQGWIAAAVQPAAVQVWVHDGAGAVIGHHRDAGSADAGDVLARVLAACDSTDLSGLADLPLILSGFPVADRSKGPLVPTPPLHGLVTINAPTRSAPTRAIPPVAQKSPLGQLNGQQTSIAGLLAGDPEFDGVVCVAGPQTVWARISAGEIVSFQLFLTLEVADALAQTPFLARALADTSGADDLDAAAFATALDEAMSRPQVLAAALHQIGAAFDLGANKFASGRGRLMGLLIGLELAGARPYWLGQRVAVIGAAAQSALYDRALRAQGVPTEVHPGDEMVLAGLRAAFAASHAP